MAKNSSPMKHSQTSPAIFPRASRSRIALMMVLPLLLALQSKAALVVDLQPSDTWVASNTDLARSASESFDSGTNEATAEVTFDDTTTLSPAGTAAAGQIFYGGWKIVRTQSNSGTNLFPRNRINDNNPDSVVTGANSANPSPGVYQYTAAYVWKKSDFQAGGDVNQVDITSDTALSARASEGLFGDVSLRWIVQASDSNWYVSDESFALTGSLATVSSQNLTTTDWAQVDLDTAVDSAFGSFGSLNLDDVQAAGYYLSGGSRNATFDSFSFEASVIPEPSVATLLLSFLLIGVAAHRRRRS